MTAPISITIPGAPVAKGRARFNSKTGRAYTPTKTRHFEKLVAQIASLAMAERNLEPFTGAVEIVVRAYLPIPPSWPKWKRQLAAEGHLAHVGTPDIDNIIKGIFDGLKSIVWDDDSQVVSMVARKSYDGTPRTGVYVTPTSGAHSGMKKRAEIEA